jgi:predicted aconitase with swiveling domain
MVRTLSFQLSNTSSILVQGTKSGCSVMVTRVKKNTYSVENIFSKLQKILCIGARIIGSIPVTPTKLKSN